MSNDIQALTPEEIKRRLKQAGFLAEPDENEIQAIMELQRLATQRAGRTIDVMPAIIKHIKMGVARLKTRRRGKIVG